MDYKFKLYKLMAISKHVNNKEKIYKDIEETILKIPDFTEPYFDMFLICDKQLPLVHAILNKYDIELIKLLYKHYHAEDTLYIFRHECRKCGIYYLDGKDVKGNLEFLIKAESNPLFPLSSYYQYMKKLSEEFNIKLIDDFDEWHEYILNNVC